MKLYGKKATQDDILEEINRLLYAKGNRPYPLKPSEIANAIGMSRQSVYNYIKKLSNQGNMVRLQSGQHLLVVLVMSKSYLMMISKNKENCNTIQLQMNTFNYFFIF